MYPGFCFIADLGCNNSDVDQHVFNFNLPHILSFFLTIHLCVNDALNFFLVFLLKILGRFIHSSRTGFFGSGFSESRQKKSSNRNWTKGFGSERLKNIKSKSFRDSSQKFASYQSARWDVSCLAWDSTGRPAK